MNCQRNGCTGVIDDGYCDRCGLAPRGMAQQSSRHTEVIAGRVVASGPSATRRTTTSKVEARVGRGLVASPPIEVADPSALVQLDPQVGEHKRFCSRCDSAIGRSRNGRTGRAEGYCSSCGQPFSFLPKLAPGDLVGGQYEVVGCLAHGGLGWVYLAKDRRLEERWVVLKGVLNTGDHDAIAVALAERRFLASVAHENIVKVHNFVEHCGEGYIVMEYVTGLSLRTMLENRRAAEGKSLPVSLAVGYMLDVLPALSYLHRLDLLYCDLKPDNVICSGNAVKLIDLGGVYRADDTSSPIYGTAGYQAPEVATTGPTVESDIFTVGRTLAVLCTDFRGYQSTFQYTLRTPAEEPVFARWQSLYMTLARATAPDPTSRFASVDEMADQLFGVLREVQAAENGKPVAGHSTLFTGERRSSWATPAWRDLPRPLVSADDPAAGLLAIVPDDDSEQVVTTLRNAPEQTVEVRLRLARTLIARGQAAEAESLLLTVARDDPADWRVDWHRALDAMAHEDWPLAQVLFGAVNRKLPGEFVPRLALGEACEAEGRTAEAIQWYEVVSHTDDSLPTASLALARCLGERDELDAALLALDRVPASSSAFLEAQTEKVGALTMRARRTRSFDDVVAAGTIVDSTVTDPARRADLMCAVLETALELIEDGGVNESQAVAGVMAVEREVRFALEESYRTVARQAVDRATRIQLVDRANSVRPRTLI